MRQPFFAFALSRKKLFSHNDVSQLRFFAAFRHLRYLHKKHSGAKTWRHDTDVCTLFRV